MKKSMLAEIEKNKETKNLGDAAREKMRNLQRRLEEVNKKLKDAQVRREPGAIKCAS